MENSNSRIIQKSMGWSFFSEIAAKFVTPITNMLLARILTPDAFGVLAICNMLVSFVDIITDAGFGKYLVQADIESEEEKNKLANVAFWSNLSISGFLYFIIIINRIRIAGSLGGEQYSTVICVASFQLILTSVSSIQTGLFRRKFEFKKLFVARITVAIIPLLVSVPFAYFTRSYWALIIGTLAGAFANSVVLTVLSPWRPQFYYSFELFKRMFSFSFWSMCEGLANWAIFWFDTFIVTHAFSEYYVGIYKNSANMVMSIMGMISASMSPVLLSVLSRVKADKEKFFHLFLTIQRIMLYLVFPMGVGLFCYRHIATYILFGSQWNEAANIVGCWGLMMMCSIIFYSFTAELYKSSGVPKILFAFQVAYLVFVVPVCIVCVNMGFWIFVYVRCFCVIEQVLMSLIFMKYTFKFNILKSLKNMIKPFAASMSIIGSYLGFRNFMRSYVLEFVFMLASAIVYLAVLIVFFRKDLLSAKNEIQNVNLK